MEKHKFFCNCGFSCRTKGDLLGHTRYSTMYHFQVLPGQIVPEHLKFKTPGERKAERKKYKKTIK